MIKAIISAEGQIALPKVLRDRLKLKAGTQVLLDVQGDSLVMTRADELPGDWRTMRGMFRGVDDLLQDLAAERESELTSDDARVKSH